MPPHLPLRYTLARAAVGLCRGLALDGAHPQAGAWQHLSGLAGDHMVAIGAADNALRQGLGHANRVKEAIALGDALASRAEEVMQKALTDAGPRFSEAHPAAQKLAQSQETLGLAVQQEHAIMNEGLELERKHGSAQMAALLAKNYGTPSYKAGRLEKWMDERTAAKVGLNEFIQQQNQLMARLNHARQAREAAQAQVALDQRAMEAAWEQSGMSYVNAVDLEDARQWQSLAMLDGAQLQALLRQAEHDNGQARRALAQTICEFHKAVGAPLKAFCSEDHSGQGLPEIDPTPFVSSHPRSDEDHARVDTLRKTHLAFLGQGHWPNQELPAWVLLAYGNTDGLPGATMAQTTMGATSLLDESA